MATSTHKLVGITRTLDDAVVPYMIDEDKPVSDTTEAILAAAHDLGVLGAKGTAVADDVIEFATLIGITVEEPAE